MVSWRVAFVSSIVVVAACSSFGADAGGSGTSGGTSGTPGTPDTPGIDGGVDAAATLDGGDGGDSFGVGVTIVQKGLQAPAGIAADDQRYFWSEQGTGQVQRGNVATNDVSPIGNAGGAPAAIAIDTTATNVYWVVNGPGAGVVKRGPVGGAGEANFYTPSTPHPIGSIAVTQNRLVVLIPGQGAGDGALEWKALFTSGDASSPTVVPNLQQPYGIAWAGGDSVVWSASADATVFLATETTKNPIATSEIGPTAVAAVGTTSTFWLLPSTNAVRAKFTTTTTLSDATDTMPSQIAADSRDVYWIDSDPTKPGLGRLRRSTDKGPITVAANFVVNTVAPAQSPKLALNKSYVYWLTNDSMLRYTRP